MIKEEGLAEALVGTLAEAINFTPNLGFENSARVNPSLSVTCTKAACRLSSRLMQLLLINVKGKKNYECF